MNRLLLVTIALTLCIIASKAGATTLSDEYKKPQHYGIFKLYIDEHDRFIITRSQWLNINLVNGQAWNLHGNHYQDYFKFQKPNQKALFAYQFLLKVAKKADIRASISLDANDNRHLGISIIEDSVTKFAYRQALIPYKDMKTVFPLLLDLIKSQTKIHFEFGYDNKARDIVKSDRHQTIEYTQQQAWDIADNYNYGFNCAIAEDKALLVYMFLLRLAFDTNFNVIFSKKYQSNNALMLNIAAQGLDEGVEFELIPADEIKSVYPLVLEFMEDRSSTGYIDPKIVTARINQEKEKTNN